MKKLKIRLKKNKRRDKNMKYHEKQQEIIPSSDQNPTNVTNKKTKKSFFQKPINLILVALAISGAGVVIYLLRRKK
jgi:hypothetical protein